MLSVCSGPRQPRIFIIHRNLTLGPVTETLHVRKPVGSNLSVSVWVWILGSFYPIPLHEGCMVPKVKVVELFVPCWFQLALGGKAFVVILCPVESKSRHIDQIVVLFDRS